jgi:hypothetical protein
MSQRARHRAALGAGGIMAFQVAQALALGQAGEQLALQMLRNPNGSHRPVMQAGGSERPPGVIQLSPMPPGMLRKQPRAQV